MKLLIKVGSITNAQRCVNILSANKYKSKIVRIENPTKEEGCGYGVEVMAKDKSVIKILKNKGINIKGVEIT